PVTLAARSLGQRGREGSHGRTGRHVGQPLDRECGALELLAEAVIRYSSATEPLAPEVTRRRDLRVRLGNVRRSGQLLCPGGGPGGPAPRRESGPPTPPAALEPEGKIGDEADRHAAAGGIGSVPLAVDELPLSLRAAVVEHRLAGELDLDRAVDALDRAN